MDANVKPSWPTIAAARSAEAQMADLYIKSLRPKGRLLATVCEAALSARALADATMALVPSPASKGRAHV